MPFRSKAQQRFMYATMPKTAEKWSKETPNIKKLPQHVTEEPDMHQHLDTPEYEDKIGQVFVVLKPEPESQPTDIVHQTDVFGAGQFDPHTVHGVYNEENEANLVAEAICGELQKHLGEVEKKKHTVVEKIDKHIARLQKEINQHMKEASELPEQADKSHALAEEKMETIKGLREKRKMVEASKKPVEKIEEGFFDRLAAKAKGLGSQVKTSAGNIGAIVKGDLSAIKDTKAAKSATMLKQKAKTFGKEIDDLLNDLEKLFPSETEDKLPPEFAKTYKSYLQSLEAVKKYNEYFATGNMEKAKNKAIVRNK